MLSIPLFIPGLLSYFLPSWKNGFSLLVAQAFMQAGSEFGEKIEGN